MRVMIALALAALAFGCGTGEPVSRTIGARCDVSTQCDERCLTGGEFPGGFCSISCDNNLGCPADTACADDQGGVCLFLCSGDPDCTFLGAGWKCETVGDKPMGTVQVCRGG